MVQGLGLWCKVRVLRFRAGFRVLGFRVSGREVFHKATACRIFYTYIYREIYTHIHIHIHIYI